ncbi:MAG: radical SAM protein [Thermodesulfobacteriota bacterium]
MKVLLLNPPTSDNKMFIREGRCTQEQGVWATLWPPISLATIGAVLEKDGHEVKIVDCAAQGVSWSELGQLIENFLPHVVIWSTGTPSIENDLELASFIKKCDKKILTAVFGTHVTALDRECMESFPEIDCIIRNEPEMTSKELLKVLQEKFDFKEILGLTFRNNAGDIIANPPRPFIEDLDSLPLPAWHLIKLDYYRLPLKGKRYLMISPLRGCPFKCSFCTCQTYYGKKLRKRSIEGVLKEIEYNIEQFGIRDFFFWAETFVVDKEYVKNLCSTIIERGIDISWTSNSRVDTVDGPLLKLMAEAGCWMISYGIESGSQKVLDEANKGTRIEQAYEAVRYAKEAGIKTVGHFILGLPGETEVSIKHTINYANQLGLDIAQFYCAVPFPGSILYERALKEGWIKNSDYGCFKQDNALMELSTISPQVVNRYRKIAYRKFYFNLKRGYSTLRLVNWKDLGKVFSAAKDFLGWSSRG